MTNRKSTSIFFAAIAAAAALAIPTFAHAQTAEVASGVVTGTSLGGGEWQYDITLSNNSSADNANTTIGTFWFSWAPGEDFMEALPTNIVAPTGWTAALTGRAHAGDGSAIQFVALSTDLLHAGSSLSGFQFDSTETPTQLAAPSSFFENELETQSAAYVGAPFSDTTNGGDVFTLSVVNGSSTTPPTNPGGNTGNTQGGSGGTGDGTAAVPLPAAFTQTLAGLIGLGLLAAGKKLARRPARH